MSALIDKKHGGPIKKTGIIHAHKGEFVLTAEQASEMQALLAKFKAENMLGKGARTASKR